MSEHVESGPPTDVFDLPQEPEPAKQAPLDLKLKIMIGSNFSVELVKSRLSEGAPEVIALLASKYVLISPLASHTILLLLLHRLGTVSLGLRTNWLVGGAKKELKRT